MNVWVIWVTRILSFVCLAYLSFAFTFKMILFTTAFTMMSKCWAQTLTVLVQPWISTCKTLSINACLFFIRFILFSLYLSWFTFIFIYQLFVSNKDLLGLFLPLMLPVHLITILLLNFVNVSNLLKLFFRDGLHDN